MNVSTTETRLSQFSYSLQCESSRQKLQAKVLKTKLYLSFRRRRSVFLAPQ